MDALGGAAKAIAAGFFQEEIARSAYEYQLRVERGETVIVGVNKFADDAPPPVIPAPDFSKLAREQVERVRAVRAKRDATAAERAMRARCGARRPAPAASRPPLMPLIVDAVRARVTARRDLRRLRRRLGRPPAGVASRAPLERRSARG